MLDRNLTIIPSKVYLYVGIYFFLFIWNIIFRESAVGLLITIPQYLIVLFFLFIRKNYRKACFFHLLFIVLSLDGTSSLLGGEGGAVVMYSYAKLKVVGSIGFNHLIGIFLWLCVKLKFPIIGYKDSLFYQSNKVISILALGGISIGIIGLGFFDYSFLYFMKPVVYICNAFLYTDILLRLYNILYVKQFYFHSIYLLIAAPIASAFCFHCLGIHSIYSTEDAFIYNEMFALSPSLLIALLQLANRKWLICFSLGCYLLNLYVGGRGSHFVLIFAALCFFLYQLYFCSGNAIMRFGIFVIMIISVPTLSGFLFSASKLSLIKLNEVLSLTNLFWGDADFMLRIRNIPESPFVRISEVLNILHNGLSNPLGLIFGNGYGGYFTDSLGLFRGLTLLGGYSDDVIVSGKFTTAHSVYPNVLLFNGIIGLYLLIGLGLKYLFKMRTTFLAFAALLLFLYSFYFNPIMLVCCIFLLYGAEYKLRNSFL